MYGTAAWLAARLSGPTARVLAESAAMVVANSGSLGTLRRRKLVAGHLSRVYAHSPGGGPIERNAMRRAVNETFASYARYWAESFRLPSVRPAELCAGMSSDGFEHLFEAWAGGRGVILALPHLGGWEWGGAWLASQGVPVSVVVETLEPAELFEWFVGLRRSLGFEVIAAGTGAGSAALRALQANRVLCLLCDRVVNGGSGVEVDLFGDRTLLPAGPVTLALRSGAPLLPSAVYFTPGRPDHLAVVRPPLVTERAARMRVDVARGTQALAGELEVLIRRAPTQWHLMQPNWPNDPGWSRPGP